MLLVVGLTVAAFCTATISGAIGLGGGTILMAILLSTHLTYQSVIATHSAVQLVSNGARTVAYFKHVKWRALALFLIGAIPSAFIIAKVFVWLGLYQGDGKKWAQLVLGIFILLVTLTPKLKHLRSKSRFGLFIAGTLAGGVGMVVGATGTLIAPFYLREGWSRETIIGTKALCQSCAHVVKLLAIAFVVEELGKPGSLNWEIVIPMAIAMVIGTVAGKHIGSYLNQKLFRLIFKGTIVAVAIYLIVKALLGLFGSGWI